MSQGMCRRFSRRKVSTSGNLCIDHERPFPHALPPRRVDCDSRVLPGGAAARKWPLRQWATQCIPDNWIPRTYQEEDMKIHRASVGVALIVALSLALVAGCGNGGTQGTAS